MHCEICQTTTIPESTYERLEFEAADCDTIACTKCTQTLYKDTKALVKTILSFKSASLINIKWRSDNEDENIGTDLQLS